MRFRTYRIVPSFFPALIIRSLVLIALGLSSVLFSGSHPANAAFITQTSTPWVREVLPFQVAAPDGTVLRGHVYLPHAAGPVGTILEMNQYWNNVYGTSETPEVENQPGPDAIPLGLDPYFSNPHVELFLKEGFAFAAVNSRGSGLSDGCHQWGGRLDWSDTRIVIEALAAQPWSNGNVGMFGLSHGAWMADVALINPPPALKAVVSSSGVVDLWSVLTRHGAPYWIGPVAQTYFVAFKLSEGDRPSNYACTTHLDDALGEAALADDAVRTPYFEERDYREALRGSSVPVFATYGLGKGPPEEGADDGHIVQIDHTWGLSKNVRMMLFQGGHGYPSTPRFLEDSLGWFDHYLRGGPARVRPGVVEYQEANGDWHTSSAWPPPNVKRTGMFLDGDRLSLTPGASSSSQTFQSVTREGGKAAFSCKGAHAFYSSQPVTREISLVGNFELDLTLSSSLPGGNIVAFLYAIGDDGCGFDRSRELGHAILNLRHWAHEGRPRDFPMITPTNVRLKSLALADTVKVGERLVLVLAGDGYDIVPSKFKPVITVDGGGNTGSRLILPIAAEGPMLTR